MKPFACLSGVPAALLLALFGWFSDALAQTPPWQINVYSDGASNVTIGSNNGYGGVTDYIVYDIPHLTVVNLQAPLTSGGMNFLEWQGCTSTSAPSGSTCNVTMTANWSVNAVYVDGYQLNVNSSGVSGVAITSTTGHGGTTHYSLLLNPSTNVSLEAPVDLGSHVFIGWTGCDSISGSMCNVTMDAHKTVVANYATGSPADDFVTTWQTNFTGTSDFKSIKVPMVGGPYAVDWNNDGIFDEFVTSGQVSHDFGTIGTYTIRIRGTYDSIFVALGGDDEKIVSVNQWGTNAWTTMARAFEGAIHLSVPATDTPSFSAVTSMRRMFFSAHQADPDTSGWDTSNVTDMSLMFHDAVSASPDTSGWDTSNVTDMSSMFYNAASADPDTSGWDTTNVTDMSFMFRGATSANPNTGGWDTANVTDMHSMFRGATVATPNTSGWDTSKVTDMYAMFRGAASANPDTSGWDTSAVTTMAQMFHTATAANPDISGWDTSLVTNMSYMFSQATSFDRDIGSWNVSALTAAQGMFAAASLSISNYEALLIGWNAQALQPGVTFSGGNSHYCSDAAAAARANMVASDGWTITDGGQACPPTNPGLAPDLTPASDSGTSDTDNITDNRYPSFYVECFAAGETVTLFSDNPSTNTAIGTNECAGSGTETASVNTILQLGTHNVTYTITNIVTESSHSPPLEITIIDLPGAYSDDFVTTWNTANPGISGATQVFVPMIGGPYNIDWNNDGVFDQYGVTGAAFKDYGIQGDYTIRIRGAYDSLSFPVEPSDKLKILSVDQWGTRTWTTMAGAFRGAANMTVNAVDIPDLSSVASTQEMFSGANSANPDTSGWNTANVTNMSGMFANATAFDRDLGAWDVTALTNATGMLDGVTLSTANYENLLIGWDAQALHSGVSFSGGNSTYCSAAAHEARTHMIEADSWSITDAGQVCSSCNVVSVSGVTEQFDALHEACEILVLGPDFIATDGVNIEANSGWEIMILPGFGIQQGASFNGRVCGQSLCTTSPSPMPYGCHSCVDQICDIDASCCALEFDQACRDRVSTVCGLVCE